jgi:glucosamine-6-phosphate deaminase
VSLKNSSSNPLAVHRASSRSAMGTRAAADIASEIRTLLANQGRVRVMFAAAPSQSEVLFSLSQASNVDWSRVEGFHMDEYLGLTVDAPARFGSWLRRTIFDRLPFGAVHLIEPGDNPDRTAADYSAKLDSAIIDIVCCGVGANGHLAFNDPPADFDDLRTVKIVKLDERSRQQQVDDKCFASIRDVPTHAVTVTIPALLSARTIFCIVPGPQKNQAIRNMLEGPITPLCPATALRLHPQCTLFLDPDSAAEVSLEGYRLV